MAPQKYQSLVLPIDNLQPNPLQPRGKIKKEDVEELVGSIQQYGVLEPLVVAHTPAGYQIIAGERRWRAAKLAGLTEIPVSVVETNQRGMLEMAITENLQREDLSALERAQAFHQLQQDFRLGNDEIAKRMGKSSSYVSNSIRLLTLPDAIKDGLSGGVIEEGHARALLTVPDQRLMLECYKQLLRENATVRRAEELSRRYKELSDHPPKTQAQENRILARPQIQEWQERLQTVFRHANVRISQSNRHTEVVFKIKANPEIADQEVAKILKLADILPPEVDFDDEIAT
jgi:ParB family transcriptional regulator, chromosome partitioning protein